MSRFAEVRYTLRRNRSRFAWFILAMFLFSAVLVLTITTLQISWTLKESILRQFQLEVYLQPSATSVERDSVLMGIKRRAPAGTSFRYISPGEAREKFIQEFGPDLLDVLGENPLPASYIITLPKIPDNLSKMRELQRFAADMNAVDEAIYEGELAGWVERWFSRSVPYIIGIGTTLAVIFIAIGLFILRSAVISSFGTANTLLMLGASPGYFRQPYHRLAALIGGLAGVLAVTCGWIISEWFSQRGTLISPSLPLMAFIVPIVTFIIGWILGWLATRGAASSIKQLY